MFLTTADYSTRTAYAKICEKVLMLITLEIIRELVPKNVSGRVEFPNKVVAGKLNKTAVLCTGA